MRTMPWMAATALLLAGCTDFRSINPIADPAEKLEDPGITGDWVIVPAEPGQDSTATGDQVSETVSRMEHELYRITAVPRNAGEYRVTSLDSIGDAFHLRARPTMIGGRLVIDTWPDAIDADADFLPVHTPLFVLRIAPDTIVLTTLEKAESLLAGGKWGSGLPHMWIRSRFIFDPDSNAIVTATTTEIRRFLALVQTLPDALSNDRVTLRRLR